MSAQVAIVGLRLAFGPMLLATVGFVLVGACGASPASEFLQARSNGGVGGGADGGPTSVDGQFQGGGGGGGGSAPTCKAGVTTTVRGTVYAPNGTLPLYNAVVYIPTGPVPPLLSGATCDVCGATNSVHALASAVSGADGSFTLSGVPAGTNVPLVIQMGKWRRQIVIPKVVACEDTVLRDPQLTRLPKNRSEGDIPRIALTTGGCDNIGCLLPKVGIDPNEIGVEADGDSKAVHVYGGSSVALTVPIVGTGAGAGSGGGTGASPTLALPAPAPPKSATAQSLWSSASTMKHYDLMILSCECGEADETKGPNARKAMTDYLNAGGRIFTTDFMYTWYRDSPDATLSGAATIAGGAPPAEDPIDLDTSFPKGKALSDWLKITSPSSIDIQQNKIQFDEVFANVSAVDTTKVQTWARSRELAAIDPTATPTPRVFSVNMPAGSPTANQCGRAVHIDAHVNQNLKDAVNESYPAGCSTDMSEGEAMLAFFFFDLSACIQKDTEAPKPPPVQIR